MAAQPDKLVEALALHQQGRLDAAEALYRAVLSEAPDHADARHLLGLVAHQRGDHTEALNSIDRAIHIAPDVAMYHANRARILRVLGRPKEAVRAARRALKLDPENAETLCELAGAFLECERSVDALAAAEEALARAPGLEAARLNLALAHFAEGRRRQTAGNLPLAESHYRSAVGSEPAMAEAWVNLGNVVRLLYRPVEAADCYARALSENPEVPEAWANLGVARQELGDTAGAVAAYDRALAGDPGNPEIRRNRAQALLKLGRFDEGWPEFEWRWQTDHFAAVRRAWEKPRWQGEDLAGTTVLVHAEQGYGDSLQFARYLPMLAERGARVVVECPDALIGLLARLPGVEAAVSVGATLPAHDCQIPMMSLPGAFGTDFSDLPASVPYLSVAGDCLAEWAERFRRADGRRRVGLVWKGSANHQRNEWRSPGLAALAPLAAHPGLDLYSLQKDDEAADLEAAGLTDRVTPLGREFRDFNDTAAAVANLDLVISPDTAVAHLAGALAKPVWLILPFSCEWRWLEGRDDSPWYPTMRLFRQPALDDWAGAVAAMSAELG